MWILDAKGAIRIKRNMRGRICRMSLRTTRIKDPECYSKRNHVYRKSHKSKDNKDVTEDHMVQKDQGNQNISMRTMWSKKARGTGMFL